MAAARRGRKAQKSARRGLTQTARVINAVKAGAQDAPTISRKARVPPLHVHPILSRLRKQGIIRGFTGNLRVDARKVRSR